MRYLIAACCCCLALCAPAHADVTLEYHDEDGEPAFTMLVKGGLMRMDTHDDEQSRMLFDAAKNEITVLHGQRREYIVLDEPTLERLQAQMRQAFEMMERLGMDPEALGLGAMPEPGRQVRTGESRTVGGHRCDVFRYEVEGRAESISCVAPPESVGVPADDWQTVSAMFAMMRRMVSSIVPGGFDDFEFTPDDGVLIESTDGDGGNRQRLAGVDDATLDAAAFRVPAGWRRADLDIPEMPGMPGR